MKGRIIMSQQQKPSSSKKSPPKPKRGFFGVTTGNDNNGVMDLNALNRMYQEVSLNNNNKTKKKAMNNHHNHHNDGQERLNDYDEPKPKLTLTLPGSKESYEDLLDASRRTTTGNNNKTGNDKWDDLDDDLDDDFLETSRREVMLSEFYNATEKEAERHIFSQDHFAELDEIQQQQQRQQQQQQNEQQQQPLVGLGGRGNNSNTRRQEHISMIHGNDELFAHVSEVVDYDYDNDGPNGSQTDHGVNLLL